MARVRVIFDRFGVTFACGTAKWHRQQMQSRLLAWSYMLSVLLSALCPPAPLKSLTFWRYTNQIIIIIIIIIM